MVSEIQFSGKTYFIQLVPVLAHHGKVPRQLRVAVPLGVGDAEHPLVLETEFGNLVQIQKIPLV